MRKHEEARCQHSCWSKAENQEMLFVLLARDEAAPFALRAWAEKRVELGLNGHSDPQIVEALECAAWMEHQRQHASAYMPMWAERKRLEGEMALERR